MAKSKMIRARVLRDFNDAGTERRFTAGKVVPLTEGEFDNFAAAGLVAPAPAAPAPAAVPVASAEIAPAS